MKKILLCLGLLSGCIDTPVDKCTCCFDTVGIKRVDYRWDEHGNRRNQLQECQKYICGKDLVCVEWVDVFPAGAPQ